MIVPLPASSWATRGASGLRVLCVQQFSASASPVLRLSLLTGVLGLQAGAGASSAGAAAACGSGQGSLSWLLLQRKLVGLDCEGLSGCGIPWFPVQK